MKKSFNCKRFWNYFKYDLVQMWRNNGKAVLVIGGLGLIMYVVHVLGSLIFAPHIWEAPSIGLRFAIFQCALIALYLFQARSYGHLTEKRAGSSWLMIPVSAGEKVLSMLLITLVVMPLGFLVVHLGIDALLALMDPTCNGSLIADGIGALAKSSHVQVNLTDSEKAAVVVPAILCLPLSMFCGLTYFLLGGLIFKKWKITGSLAVLFGIMLVLLFTLGLVTQDDAYWTSDSSEVTMIRNLLWYSVGALTLVWVALMGGVYRRITNLKH